MVIPLLLSRQQGEELDQNTVTGRVVAKASGPQYHSVKPSSTTKTIEAKYQQETQKEGSPTPVHEHEESVDPSVVPQVALVGYEKAFSSLPQNEVTSQQRILVINETMAVGGCDIWDNGPDEAVHPLVDVDKQNSSSVTVAASRAFSSQVESVDFPPVMNGSVLELIQAPEEREVATGANVQTYIEEIEEVNASPERGHQDCVSPVATPASPAGSSQPNVAGSQSLEACVAPKVISEVEEKGLGEKINKCIDDKDTVVGTQKREHEGDACTVARTKSNTVSRESDMAVSNPVGEDKVLEAISVSWKLASDKSLGSVAGPKRRGQNDGVSTVSKVTSEAESTQEDAVCFTLVEPAFSTQSDASSSISSDVDNLSQLVATLADDGGEVPTDVDAECIGDTNEAGLRPLQSIKGGEVSVTTMLPRRATSGSNTATSTSGTPGVILSSVGTAAAKSTKKCAEYIFSLSGAQLDLTFKFKKGSGFAISSEAQPGIEKKRGEVFVERAANDSESLHNFASSENSESRP